MHDVFVSYASRDRVFVDRLTTRLKAEKTRLWRDIFDADYTELQAQITEAVRNCVIFLFVVSPDSLRSAWCQQELSLARSYNKRIICVMRRLPDPEQLAEAWETNPQKTEWLDNCNYTLQQTWVNFRKKTDPAFEVDYDAVRREVRNPEADGIESDEADFEVGARDLLQKMTIIPEDEKRRRKWELDARDWTNATDAKIKSALLLRGDELKSAEGWLTRARVLSPEVGPFIAASQIERTRVKRRNRAIGGVFGVVLVALAVVGVAAVITRQFFTLNQAASLENLAVNAYRSASYTEALQLSEQAFTALESAPLPVGLSAWLGAAANPWDWYRQHGQICLMLHDLSCAESYLRRAVETMPTDRFDRYSDYVALGQVYLMQESPNLTAAEEVFQQAVAVVPPGDDYGFHAFIAEYLIARAYLRADFERGNYAAVVARYENESAPNDFLHQNLPTVLRISQSEEQEYLNGLYIPYQLDVWYMLAASYEETLASEAEIEAMTCRFWENYLQYSVEYIPITRTLGELDRLDDAFQRIEESPCFKNSF